MYRHELLGFFYLLGHVYKYFFIQGIIGNQTTSAEIGFETSTSTFNISQTTSIGEGTTIPQEGVRGQVAKVGQTSFDTQEGFQDVAVQETLNFVTEDKKTEQIKETTEIQPLSVTLSETRVPEYKADKSTNQPSNQDIKQVSKSTELQPMVTALTLDHETVELVAKETNKDTDITFHKVGIDLEHQVPHLHDISGITVESTQEVNVTMMPDALFYSFCVFFRPSFLNP